MALDDRHLAPIGLSRRDLLRVFGAGAGAVALGACTAERPTTAGSTAIGVGMANVFLDLDPHVATTIGTIAINNLFLYEGLYTLDPRTRKEYAPELATAPLERVDGTTYRCTLRKKVAFHDGSKMTADDVVFSFERMKDPDTGSLLTSFVEPIDEVVAVDDRTVEFRLAYPTSVVLDRVALVKVMSRSYVTSTGKKARGLKPVGSGPYRVTDAVSNERVEMAAFDGYNGPRKPWLKKVTSRVITDGNARVTALTSSRVQAIEEVPYPSIRSLRKTKGTEVEAVASCGYSNFLFHCGKPPFDDRRVRQAVLYAIDRDTIAKSVFFGQAESAKSLLCEENPFFKEPTRVYDYDPDKAKALLAEAGVAKGTRLEMLISNADYILPQGTIVQQNLADVGLRVTLKPGETEANFSFVTDGSYSFYLTLGDVSIFSWDPVVQLSFLYKGALPKTLMYWQNAPAKRVARLLSDADRAESDDERRRIVGTVQDLVSEEVPLWPVHHRRQPTGWRDTLTGFQPIPSAGFDLSGVRAAG